jgi:copper chaperone CopZ
MKSKEELMIRTLALLAGFSLISSPAFACPAADAAAFAAAAETVQKTTGTKASFKVAGLTCGSCSDKVTAALDKLEGVIAAAVDYQTGEAKVAFDSEKTNPKKLLAAIKATGFDVQLDDQQS